MSWQRTAEYTGTSEQVDQWIKDYFRSYHPAGYGTIIEWRRKNEDGTETVKVSRSHSCD